MNRASGLSAVFGLVLMALAWQVSGHFRPWTAFQQQWLAALGAALIVLAAALGSRRWAWPRPALLMVALAIVPLVQGLTGQIAYRSDWSLAVMYVLAFALSIAAAHQLAGEERERWPDNLMWVILIGAGVSAALALAQWLRVELPHVSVEPLPPGERVFANLGQANHLATLQCLGIVATLYFFERRTLGRTAAAVLTVFMAWALVLTQSRVGWVVAGVIALWWWSHRPRLRLSGRAVAAGVIAYTLGTLIWPPLNRALFLAASFTGLEQRVTAGTRPANWLALLEASLREPWLGWGWTQVSKAQLTIGTERIVTNEVIHNAHNVLIDLIVWMGWPAAMLVGWIAVRWLYVQVRHCQDPRHWAFLLAIAAIVIHALTEYPLDYTYFLFPLGLLVGTAHQWGPAAPSWSTGRSPVLAAWMAGVAMLFWIGVEYLQVEDAARNVRMAMAGVGIDKVRHVPPPGVKLLDAPREYHRFWNTPAARGMSAEQLDWMRTVAYRNHFPPVLLRYALAAGLKGRPAEARRMLLAICHLNAEARCREARESWRAAQVQYPELASIPPP